MNPEYPNAPQQGQNPYSSEGAQQAGTGYPLQSSYGWQASRPGYAQNQGAAQGSMPANGYAANGQQVYGYPQGGVQNPDPQNAYAPNGTNQGGYGQNPYGQGIPNQNGYVQGIPNQGGYAAGSNHGAGYNQGGYTQGSYGAYGYGANGYPQNGYAPNGFGQNAQNAGWQGGYQPQNPYMQSGAQPSPNRPQPVQPQPEPPRPQGTGIKPRQVFMALLCVVVPACFLLGMLVPGLGAMRWVFLVLAVLGLALVWVGSLMKRNNRLFLTLIYLLMIGVTVYGLASQPAADSRVTRDSTTVGTGSVTTGDNGQNSGLPAMDAVENSEPPTATPAPDSQTPVPASSITSEMLERLNTFMYFWKVNDVDSMVQLCAPSWARQQTGANGPQQALFVLMANRLPEEWEFVTTSGTDSDITRTVTMQAYINRNWGTDTAPVLFQFKVVMMQENDVWYVDPRTLGSNEVTPTPYVSAEITQPPQPATDAAPDTILYYNPDGGQMYHLDAYCPMAKAQFLPFKGTFTYAQVNDKPYSDLIPCSSCGAPLRPGE